MYFGNVMEKATNKFEKCITFNKENTFEVIL